MKTIRELTNRVEEAHSRHLREVKSLEDQTRRITSEQAAVVSGTPAPANGGFDFESLVNGKSSNPLQQQGVSADIFGEMNSSMPSTPTLFPPSAPSPSPLSYSPQPVNQTVPTQAPLYSTSANTADYSPYQQSQLANSSFSAISPMQAPMQPMGNGSTISSFGQPSSGFGQPSSGFGQQQASGYGQQQSSSFGQQSLSFGQSSNYGQSPSITSSIQSAKPAINWGANTTIPTLQPPKGNNTLSSAGFSSSAARTSAPTTPNYAAMQNLSLNSTTSSILQPQQQQMSSGMGMLQPLSPMNSGSRTTPSKTSTNKKSSDLDLFDPLG
jgi:SCY1-like protein 2